MHVTTLTRQSSGFTGILVSLEMASLAFGQVEHDHRPRAAILRDNRLLLLFYL